MRPAERRPVQLARRLPVKSAAALPVNLARQRPVKPAGVPGAPRGFPYHPLGRIDGERAVDVGLVFLAFVGPHHAHDLPWYGSLFVDFGILALGPFLPGFTERQILLVGSAHRQELKYHLRIDVAGFVGALDFHNFAARRRSLGDHHAPIHHHVARNFKENHIILLNIVRGENVDEFKINLLAVLYRYALGISVQGGERNEQQDGDACP